MTIATTTMSLFIRERAQVQTAESSSVQPAASGTEAEACRLAAAVGRGDEAAFRQLYDSYQPRLFRLALVLGRGDDSLAQDAVQAAFVTAAKKLRRAESDSHLWNWLARVARQHISKAWRQQQRDSAVVNVAELPECAGPPKSETGLEKSLDAALVELEPEERQLIERFYFDRLSHQEIARKLGVTPKAVSSRLERAREKLRRFVARKLPHET